MITALMMIAALHQGVKVAVMSASDAVAANKPIGAVNGQFVVPAGGQVKVSTLRVFLSGC
jgi:hypothetical protein